MIADLKSKLQYNRACTNAWNTLTPIAQRDFIAWITSAKKKDTRALRIDKACSMLLAGKRRPCCFSVVPMNLYGAIKENPKASVTWKSLSSDERRDFTDWIRKANTTGDQSTRVASARAQPSAGKRHP